jgi:ABC-2 type transport system ATP-binding protein
MLVATHAVDAQKAFAGVPLVKPEDFDRYPALFDTSAVNGGSVFGAMTFAGGAAGTSDPRERRACQPGEVVAMRGLHYNYFYDDVAMNAAIQLSGISKIFRVPSALPWKPGRTTHALRDLSLSCPAGKITCLLGPNGAGKTTVIKILAGLIRPDRGTAEILGRPLERYDQKIQSRIGLGLTNERSLYWRLTGQQNLEFFASLHGLTGQDRRRQVSAALAEVELETEADKQVRLYSTGMKKRLILARTLLGRPEIFLLDEPTSNLDPTARERILRLITDRLVGQRGCTILLCSNDLAESEKLAEHLVLLDRGRAVAEGSLPELQGRLRYEPRLILSFSEPPEPGWEAGLDICRVERNRHDWECTVRDKRTIPLIAAAAARTGKLLGCRIMEPSLGEVFASLTGNS